MTLVTPQLSPATQMASDGVEMLTEAQRLAIAIDIVNGVTQRASIAALRRIQATAKVTAAEIEASRMVDALPPKSSIDRAFLEVVLGFYNVARSPSLISAYRHAVMKVTGERLPCCVSSEAAVRHAISAIRCDQREAH